MRPPPRSCVPSSDIRLAEGGGGRLGGPRQPFCGSCPPPSPQEILHILHRDVPCCVQSGVSTDGRVNGHGREHGLRPLWGACREEMVRPLLGPLGPSAPGDPGPKPAVVGRGSIKPPAPVLPGAPSPGFQLCLLQKPPCVWLAGVLPPVTCPAPHQLFCCRQD